MISSEEFQQKLQTGQIQAALALILRDATELDITTRIAEDSIASDWSTNSEYIRTKIDLRTGKIENEVGKDSIEDSRRYLKLQQLHLDQIVSSHQIVQSYLQQIQSILTVLSPTQVVDVVDPIENLLPLQQQLDDLGEPIIGSMGNELNKNSIAISIQERLRQHVGNSLIVTPPDVSQPTISNDQPNLDSLVTRLTQANVKSRNVTSGVDSISTNVQQAELTHKSDILRQHSSPASSDHHRTPVYPVTIDDDLDLSIDPAGAVWEEWVEDEDFMADSPHSSPTSSVTTPEWEEYSVRRHLNPIDLKPTISRQLSGSIHPATQWDNFVPEHIGISSGVQPQIGNNNNSKSGGLSDDNRVNRLLTDLDI
jgi:hypothetical protein